MPIDRRNLIALAFGLTLIAAVVVWYQLNPKPDPVSTSTNKQACSKLLVSANQREQDHEALVKAMRGRLQAMIELD